LLIRFQRTLLLGTALDAQARIAETYCDMIRPNGHQRSSRPVIGVREVTSYESGGQEFESLRARLYSPSAGNESTLRPAQCRMRPAPTLKFETIKETRPGT
jgi:hypothetical protein